MNRNLLRLCVGAGVFLFSLQTLAAGPSFLERLGRLLGLDKRSMSRVSKPRAAASDNPRLDACQRPLEGTHLLKLECATGTESVLWRCEGCWSPFAAGDAGVAVLRQDGLWLVEAPEKARKLLDAPGVVSILGFPAEDGARLAVVRERPDGGLPLVGLVDLGSGVFSEAPAQPATPADAVRLRTVQPGAMQGSRVLSSVERGGTRCAPREVRVEEEQGQAKKKLCEFQSVPDGGSWDRFDPSWAGKDVVYVARPLD
jgi:hypothetical protein